jgi:hypothetical protein
LQGLLCDGWVDVSPASQVHPWRAQQPSCDSCPRPGSQEKAALQRDLAKAQASVADLQAANAKLEAICADLEKKAQSYQQSVERLQRELQVEGSRWRQGGALTVGTSGA